MRYLALVIPLPLYGEDIPYWLLEELSQTSQAHWNKEDDAILQIAIKNRSLIGAPVNEYIANLNSITEALSEYQTRRLDVVRQDALAGQ